jgi:hypothetical protein
MEHNLGPMPPNELAQETVAAVANALEHYARQRAESPHELRDALHELAREARLRRIPPEQLLVVLKRIWRSLPDAANTADEMEQRRNLQRAVTMCINEYFGD